MNDIEITKGAKPSFDRRTVLKGAAWSVPVLAAAIATPMASASTTQALLAIDAGCIQVAGATLFPGFSINNVGTDTWTGGTITVVETIDLSNVDGLISGPVIRGALWPILAVQGVASGSSAGVVTGPWTTLQGGGFAPDFSKQRMITIDTNIVAGGSANWTNFVNIDGILNILEGLGLEVINRSAQIIDPSDNPPPVLDAGPRSVDYNLIGGC